MLLATVCFCLGTTGKSSTMLYPHVYWLDVAVRYRLESYVANWLDSEVCISSIMASGCSQLRAGRKRTEQFKDYFLVRKAFLLAYPKA